MNRRGQNGLGGIQVEDLPHSPAGVSEPSVENKNQPFVPQQTKSQPSLKENSRLLFIGAGIVLVLLLLAFNGITRKSLPSKQNSAAVAKQQESGKPVGTGSPSSSVTPILDTGRSTDQETDGSRVNADQIGRLANNSTKQTAPTTLGDVRPFDNSQLQTGPFQSGSQPATLGDSPTPVADAVESRNEHDAMDKASLVFVKNRGTSPAISGSQAAGRDVDWGIGLSPGTRLRARLESAVSTAVRTPVVAVIEYNYEQNGEIVIPAGTKAFGHLEAADRSGYVGIRFDSLMMPDGTFSSLEATATDLQLRPLRGKVEGKNAGKKMLVRSFAGVGEIAATLVGRGSLNQPLSESDLLRERVSNNIGQASDQTVANLVVTERIVVTVPADTAIYVVLQKPTKESIQGARGEPTMQAAHSPSIEELRQLMQLQRELNESPTSRPSQE